MRRVAVFVLLALVSCGDDPDTLSPSNIGSSSRRRASSSSSSGEAPLTGTGESDNELCWSTINAYRAKNNLKPLARWTEEESCADGQAQTDSTTNKAHGSFGRCQEMAQNECPNTPGAPEKALPACLEAMWDEGPGGGHHDAMASTQYTKVACGVFATARGSTWSVQNFR